MWRAEHGPPAHERGFTLVEVLVAFVVSAVMLSVILTGSQMAAARSQRIAEQHHALRVAHSQIEAFRAAPFVEEVRRGEDGGLLWVAREQALMHDPRGFAVLALVTVEVRNRLDQRQARLSARKLKRLTP